jgi:hypothetical protein
LSVRQAGLFVFCSLCLAACSESEADAIFGRGGEPQWIDVPQGKLKAEVYSGVPGF